jgi:hypothetical protein
LGLYWAESIKDGLQELMGRFFRAFHIVHSGFNVKDAVNMDRVVLKHSGR